MKTALATILLLALLALSGCGERIAPVYPPLSLTPAPVYLPALAPAPHPAEPYRHLKFICDDQSHVCCGDTGCDIYDF
jgi:hypothetical protein